jgi:hypothetical protein
MEIEGMSSSADAFMGIFGFKRVEGGMKTDRELLELAAKAAGFHLEYLCDMPHMIVEEWSGDPSQHPEQRAIEWNPLTDDGDALRLAVRLGIVVSGYDCSAISGVRLNQGHQDWVYGDPDEELGDEAATRRAIVRAAAAIGEQMA